MNLRKLAGVTAVISLAMAGTAFAGTWKAGEGKIKTNGGMIMETEVILRVVGNGSMEMGMV